MKEIIKALGFGILIQAFLFINYFFFGYFKELGKQIAKRRKNEMY